MATDPFDDTDYHGYGIFPDRHLRREIAALKAVNLTLTNRALDCEQSWNKERAERSELLLKRCYHAMLYHRRMTRPITDTDALINQLEQYLTENKLL